MALACGLLPLAAHAQVATDGSTGAAATTLKGPAYQIPQTLGRLSGGNLFHSFRTFSIGQGESATFTTSTPGIANVISRVTGGGMSQIDGLLRLSAADGTPGFFFINPAGVTFGNGAAIDVPGAFHVSTADHLVFADGRFEADPQRGNSFSSAAPEAFGFLGTQRAAVTLQPGALLIGRRGQALSVVAGDITLDNAVIGSGAGSLRLAAVGQQVAQVPLGAELPSLAGDLILRNGAALISAAAAELDGAPILLSAGQIDIGSGSSVLSETQGAGHAGPIDLRARDRLRFSEGGNITTSTAGAGNSADITLRTAALEMDSGGYVYGVGLADSSGRLGAIRIDAAGAARLGGGASVSTEAVGSGDGTGIQLRADSLAISDQAYLRTDAFGQGRPGDIAIDVVGRLALSGLGHIDARSATAADSGALRLKAGSLQIDRGGYIATVSSPGTTAGSGAIEIAVLGDAELASEALIQSRSNGTGDAGAVSITARHLTLRDASVFSNAVGSAGASGRVDMALSGHLNLLDASSINTSTLSSGPAGAVSIRAVDVTLADGSDIGSRSLDGGGNAGAILIDASGRVWMRNQASISSSTTTSGDGGSITVRARQALLEGGSSITTPAGTGSSGRSGNILVSVADDLALSEGSFISVLTAGSGDAGTVQVQAGSIDLRSAANIGAAAAPGSTGRAGRVELRTAGAISLRGTASITSSTLGAGDAGTIELHAARLTLDDDAFVASSSVGAATGNAGRIQVQLSGDLRIGTAAQGSADRSVISTSTQGSGNGGEIVVQARSVELGAGVGINAIAGEASQGRAGNISVTTTEDLSLRGGLLSSTSLGSGPAGTVLVRAGRILIDGDGGILASAGPNSGGQTGNIDVRARELLAMSNGASILVTNAATVRDAQPRLPTRIEIEAPVVSLRSGAVIAADSSGNVSASSIVVRAPAALEVSDGRISTLAVDGDGGAITVSTDGLLVLHNAALTTSVLGAQGNGGNIAVDAGTLLLDTGFIQANTAAANASGGLVRVRTGALVASGNSLFLGGDQSYVPVPGIFGFNVIQAAAPTGVSGVVQLGAPVLDVSGGLRELRAKAIDAGGLGRSLCENVGGSALAPSGRGGLPAPAAGLMRAEAPPGQSLAQAGKPAPIAGTTNGGVLKPLACR